MIAAAWCEEALSHSSAPVPIPRGRNKRLCGKYKYSAKFGRCMPQSTFSIIIERSLPAHLLKVAVQSATPASYRQIVRKYSDQRSLSWISPPIATSKRISPRLASPPPRSETRKIIRGSHVLLLESSLNRGPAKRLHPDRGISSTAPGLCSSICSTSRHIVFLLNSEIKVVQRQEVVIEQSKKTSHATGS